MQKRIRTMKMLAAVAAAAFLAAGCATVSNGVAADGESAQQLRWPKMADTNAIHKGGTFPNLQSLALVKPGMTKNQIQALIGEPQYGEGFGVREWDYLFNFREADGSVKQCQYKILFDTHKLSRSSHWNPEDCRAEPAPVAAAEPVAQHVELSADALFAFDRADLAHMNAQGRNELDALAKNLSEHAGEVEHVQVTGYTDRLGSAAYNRGLSMRRAQTVRGYLIDRGVPAGSISAEGRGAADPVTQCHEANRAELIACLAPNRRVTVDVTARK